MKRLSISFMTSHLQALKREAIKECCSMADVVRRIVDAWIRDKDE